MGCRCRLLAGILVMILPSAAARGQAVAPAVPQTLLKLDVPKSAEGCDARSTIASPRARAHDPRGVVMRVLKKPMTTSLGDASVAGGLLPSPNVAAQAGALGSPQVGREWLEANRRPFAYHFARPSEGVAVVNGCRFP